jgi:hypothetical protein
MMLVDVERHQPAHRRHTFEHNHVLPHSASRGQTPDEMYFGTGDGVPADLRSRGGRRASGSRPGQPIRVVRGVPVAERRRVL